jgi:uncharacterized membrane protein YkvA (DUF1232 family)
MSSWQWLFLAAAVASIAYAGVVIALVLAGRRSDARAVAGFVPDCVVLFERLLYDPRVPRRRKALLLVLLGYLATPIDLVPDFIPVAGQLDDAILLAIVLRGLLRGSGESLLTAHWPGPASSLALLRRFAYRLGP